MWCGKWSMSFGAAYWICYTAGVWGKLWFFFDVLESNVEVEILKKQVERRRNVGHIIQLCDIIVTSPFLSEEIVWYYSIALSYLTQSIVPKSQSCLEVSLVVLLFRRLCLTSHKVPFPKPPSNLKPVLP